MITGHNPGWSKGSAPMTPLMLEALKTTRTKRPQVAQGLVDRGLSRGAVRENGGGYRILLSPMGRQWRGHLRDLATTVRLCDDGAQYRDRLLATVQEMGARLDPGGQ